MFKTNDKKTPTFELKDEICNLNHKIKKMGKC